MASLVLVENRALGQLSVYAVSNGLINIDLSAPQFKPTTSDDLKRLTIQTMREFCEEVKEDVWGANPTKASVCQRVFREWDSILGKICTKRGLMIAPALLQADTSEQPSGSAGSSGYKPVGEPVIDAVDEQGGKADEQSGDEKSVEQTSDEDAKSSDADAEIQIEKHHWKINLSLWDDEAGDTGILVLNKNAENNTEFIDIEVDTATGKRIIRYFYGVQDTIKDLRGYLANRWDWPKENISIYYPNGKSFFQDWEPIGASIDGNGGFPTCVRLCIRALGGGKRARAVPKADEQVVPRDLKQQIQTNLASLKAMDGQPPLVATTVAEIENILKSVAENPDTTISNLLNHIPPQKIGLVIGNLLTISTRPEERIDYLLEHFQPSFTEGLEGLKNHIHLLKKTMSMTLLLAVRSQFEDMNGGVSWQGLLKEMTSKMANRNAVVNERGCSVM